MKETRWVFVTEEQKRALRIQKRQDYVFKITALFLVISIVCVWIYHHCCVTKEK